LTGFHAILSETFVIEQFFRVKSVTVIDSVHQRINHRHVLDN
jgi:hypothetical protein